MGAFDGLRFYQMPSTEKIKETPGPAHYPGNWQAENSNQPYEYPWGRKEKNQWFIGPYPKESK